MGPPVDIGRLVTAHVTDVWTEKPPSDPQARAATFTVYVKSIRCGPKTCVVTLALRNEEAVGAQYPCEELTATDTQGVEHRAVETGLGNTVAGCDATEMHGAAQLEWVPVTLFTAGGRHLVSMSVPGFGSIPLSLTSG